MKRVVVTLSLALLASVAGAQGRKTITVGVWPDLDSVVKAAVPGFQKTHPNIDIKVVSLSYGDHHNALTTALATGSGAGDVEAIEVGYIAKFGQGTGMVDLSQAPYNAVQYKSRFVAYTFPQATMEDGRVVGMPTDIGPGSLFYRADYLKKAGVTPSQLSNSWDSYIAAGKKIVAANPGVVLIPDAAEIAQVIWRTGLAGGEGLYFGRDGKTVVGPQNERFVRAFTVAKKIRDAGLDGRAGASWSPEWVNAFQKGNLATEVSGAWLVGNMQNWLAKEDAGKWAAAQLPGHTFTSYGGSFYGIPAQSKNKAEAWELIKYLTTDAEQQKLAFKITNAFPALRAAHNSALFNEGVPYLGGQKARLLWRQAAARIQPTNVNKYDSLADRVVNDALTQMLGGEKDVITALSEAKTLLDRRSR